MAGINVEESWINRLGCVIRCKVDNWPLKFLGLLLGGHPRSESFWDLVAEKVSRKTGLLEKILHIPG